MTITYAIPIKLDGQVIGTIEIEPAFVEAYIKGLITFNLSYKEGPEPIEFTIEPVPQQQR